ncbi:MAG: hypothetical protein H7Z72_05750 [Bacteroidetes bacterium]|nr:hypothetical protein [Fibrella sp.]
MESNPEKRNTSRNYLFIALGLMVALNVLLLYFWFQERQTNKTQEVTIAARTEEVLATRTKLDSISVQLDAKIATIQRLGGSVDSLVKIKKQLEVDKRELKNMNAFNLRRYEQKIRSYEDMLVQKDQEIVRLKAENGQLAQENQSLAQENSTLKNERQSLSDSVNTYSTRNRELAEKVTVAAALRAEGVTVNALNSRGKENDGGSYKAKRIDKVKVTFRLADNALAQTNEKDIYLRILDPTGAIISDMATGSGEFTAKGQTMIYTASQRVPFDNTRQTVSFIYGRGGQRFNEGRHVVELYAEGFKIGEGDFTVK